jgi:nitrite reductase (NO-forming)
MKGADMKGRVLVATAFLGAALVGTSLATAGQTTATAKRTVVTVSMYDMGFKLNKSVVRPGTVVFRTVNDGAVDHDFRIKGLGTPSGLGTPMLGSGERSTLTVRFPKVGRFAFVCTVPGHAAAGMKGKLTVKK